MFTLKFLFLSFCLSLLTRLSLPSGTSLIAFRLVSYRLQASLIVKKPSGFCIILNSLRARLLSPSGVSYRYNAFRLLYYKEIQLSSCSNTVSEHIGGADEEEPNHCTSTTTVYNILRLNPLTEGTGR